MIQKKTDLKLRPVSINSTKLISELNHQRLSFLFSIVK